MAMISRFERRPFGINHPGSADGAQKAAPAKPRWLTLFVAGRDGG